MVAMIEAGSPFHPDNDEGYRRWRQSKLAEYPHDLTDRVVDIVSPRRLRQAERAALQDLLRRSNFAVYRFLQAADSTKGMVRNLGAQLGLMHLDHNSGADDDAITSLSVQSDDYHRGYIPYTTRAIAWHTDGYYNTLDRQIHGIILHCVRPAVQGGANAVLDHEIVYLLLRDASADFVRALMHPQAMTIPENRDNGELLRPQQTGPVFALRPDGGLHMRYTKRKRNIEWRSDPLTLEAVAALEDILDTPGPWHHEVSLGPGEGLIGNNPLHTRTAFNDAEPGRLLYRARYYDALDLR